MKHLEKMNKWWNSLTSEQQKFIISKYWATALLRTIKSDAWMRTGWDEMSGWPVNKESK